MTQYLSIIVAFQEDLSSVPNTHMQWVTTTCNFNYSDDASGLCEYLRTHIPLRILAYTNSNNVSLNLNRYSD